MFLVRVLLLGACSSSMANCQNLCERVGFFEVLVRVPLRVGARGLLHRGARPLPLRLPADGEDASRRRHFGLGARARGRRRLGCGQLVASVFWALDKEYDEE